MKYPVNIQVFDWLPLIHVTADSICWYWTNPFLKFALACKFFQLERVTLFMQLRNWYGHLFKTERHSNWLFDSLQSVLIVKCCLVSVPLSPLWSSWSNTALPLEVPLQRYFRALNFRGLLHTAHRFLWENMNSGEGYFWTYCPKSVG